MNCVTSKVIIKFYEGHYVQSFALYLRHLTLIITLSLSLTTPLSAQEPPSIQYIYDALGRLIQVIDASGEGREYVYDAVGNLLEIRAFNATGVSILNFTPPQGAVGTLVTIEGRGFRDAPGENTLTFNGTASPVASATTTTLTVNVPPSATTGPIAVTVAGSTATSSRPFIVTPGIISLSPILALAGTDTTLQVQGSSLTGATFTFTPETTPPAVTILSAIIAPDGMSAELSISVRENAAGSVALVATAAGSRSSEVSSSANTLRLLAGDADSDGDGLSNADELARGLNPNSRDSDGDGFSDAEEIASGSNPLDAGSLPVTLGAFFSVQQPVGPGREIGRVSGAFSVQSPIGPGRDNGRATGALLSTQNDTPPEIIDRHAIAPRVSVENAGQP